jgi:hypothetical protein
MGYTEQVIDKTVFGEETIHAYVIQHNKISIQLTGGRIQNLDILKIGFKGPFSNIKERTKTILMRLRYAIDFRIHDPTSYFVIDTYEENPAVYLRGDWVGDCARKGLLIMTIYPEDAKQYGFMRGRNSVARYVLALLEAHFQVFFAIPNNASIIDNLEIVGSSREGAIFLAVYLSALDYSERINMPSIDREALRRAIDMSDVDQRVRLDMMAHFIPVDWP